MKILVLGSNGQVGFELARALLPLGLVLPLTRSDADLADLKALARVVQRLKPDVIVNAAAYTAVDKAQTETDLAFLINAKAPTLLAELAQDMGSLLIHYSTDYVFDGTKQDAYTEDDSTNPLNNYGLSKLVGEQGIAATGCDHLILRTSWVYAARGHNFLQTILQLAQAREQLSIVDDQIGAPTWARLIAETTGHIIKQSHSERQQGQFHSGIYHITAAGQTSWYGFANSIVELAGASEKYTLKCKTLSPILTTAYPLPAERPKNSRLATARLQQRFGLEMPLWDNALKLCLAELL